MSTQPSWTPLGEHVEVSTDRLAAAEAASDAAVEYAEKSHTHLWVVMLVHRATDQLLDTLDGRLDGPPLLDADTLLSQPYTGCYVCEAPYEPRLRLRRCPGAPKVPLSVKR